MSIGTMMHPRRGYLDIVKKLGLLSNLKLCLDAGDINSYPGTGTQWLDVSGNGHHFDFGATTAAPTFNGTAGRLSAAEYFSFDGGDYFTINGSNPAWVDALHEDNALFTILLPGIWIGVGATLQRILGTYSGGSNVPGITFAVAASEALQVIVRGGSGAALNQTVGGSLLNVAGGWQSYLLGLDESVGANGIRWRKGTATDNDTSTYTSPSVGAATFPLQIGAGGNGFQPLTAGSRLTGVVILNTRLSVADGLAFYNLTKGRVGL